MLYKFNPKSYHNQLFSFEGRASDSYWQAVKLLLAERFNFPGRSGRGAKDLVNSLLNYGYGILYSRVLSAVLKSGLLPFAGFLHKDRSGKSSLVLDIMEIFRQPIVDHTLLIFLSKSKVKREVDQKLLLDFATKVLEQLQTKTKFVDGKIYSWEKVINLQTRQVASYLRGNKGLRLLTKGSTLR